MDRERREDRLPGDAEIAEDFKLAWGSAEDRWTEVAGEKGEVKGKKPGKESLELEPNAATRNRWL